jgi:hypothetical protein
MPRTCFPYLFFGFITPNRSHTAWSGSASSSNGNFILFLEAQVRGERVARDAEHLAIRAPEPGLAAALEEKLKQES